MKTLSNKIIELSNVENGQKVQDRNGRARRRLQNTAAAEGGRKSGSEKQPKSTAFETK